MGTVCAAPSVFVCPWSAPQHLTSGSSNRSLTPRCGDLRLAGVSDRPTTVLADAGYWHKQQIERIVAADSQVLVPPDSGSRNGARPGWEGGFYAFMRRVLDRDHGRELYSKRKLSNREPCFKGRQARRWLQKTAP